MMIRGAALIAVLTLSLLAAPLVAEGQPRGNVWRIGYLGSGSASTSEPWVQALRRGLRELGYVEGQNIAIEYRFGDGKVRALPGLAAEMVRLNVDLIFTGGTIASMAIKDATKTIPIVFIGVGDPVGAGLVAPLGRPGANITGLSDAVVEVAPKLLQLLRDVSHRKVSNVGLVFDPSDASAGVEENRKERRSISTSRGTPPRPLTRDFSAAFRVLHSQTRW
jgi:putative ABC transport system substrate-binding protein